MFLDRVEQLDLDDPVAERRRIVDNLASMPLSDDGVKRARDVCVDAHRTIIEAEERQSRAARLLARYSAEDVPPVADRERIQQDIDHADRALARSRGLFDRCGREMQDLDLRYRRRRR